MSTFFNGSVVPLSQYWKTRQEVYKVFNEYGFTIDKNNNLDNEVKDFLVIAKGREMRFKFINDRADFFLDISSTESPENWIEFYKILQWLKEKGYIKENSKVSNKMKNIRILLKNHIGMIEKHLPNVKTNF